LLERFRRILGRWWRRAKYQWLNRSLLTDMAIAVVLFAAVFFSTLALPNRPATYDPDSGVVVACFISLPPLLMIVCFLYVRRYLKADAAYEDLRSGNRPVLAPLFKGFVRFPCSAVVLFALLTGLALAAWGLGDWGPAIRTSLIQVTTPLPPVTAVLRSVVGEEDAPWPGWVAFMLSLVYSGVVIALVAAWFERSSQRQSYVASLFTEEDRAESPYGFRPGSSPDDLQPEPHEQVLLMQADRIGAACLPYLRLELSGPEWTMGNVVSNRCRGAVVAIGRVFDVDAGSCWQGYPLESDWIADWLMKHLNGLVEQDCMHSGSSFDHRLGELMEAVAAVLASAQVLPSRPTPTSRGAYHDPDRAARFRAHLKHLFSRSPKRPALLIAACNAAERLGTPEDLRLLDEQTRRLDIQAGFTISQTDRILRTRDRVLNREPLRTTYQAELLERVKSLNLEQLPASDDKPRLFRRRTDGAVMALIVAGSFIRGNDHFEHTSPKRRVHLGSYLIDVEPVSQESFTKWIEEQGGVLRVERGFFPVQGTLDDVPKNYPYACHVTWFAAQAYAQWAVTGGHLPTEAQWEKAARGTEDDRRYPSGDSWIEGSISPFGVRLCHLLEWTQDAFDPLAYRHNPVVFDPRMESVAGAGDEAMRVVRGRNPESNLADYNLAKRIGMEPITGAFTAPIGFRVAVDLERGQVHE
jgi:formylglycine-generating enzyme required for sulfatase activity